MKAIIHANIVEENGVLEGHGILYDTKIRKIEPTDRIDTSSCSVVMDAKGKYVSPGFINLHIHGCASFDTMDATDEALLGMSAELAKHGVTRFLPTTVSMPKEKIVRALECIRRNMGKGSGAVIHGAYLEGPFFSPDYCGPTNLEYILPPDYAFVTPYLDVIKIMTVAPETDEQSFIQQVAQKGVVIALGHSGATYERTKKAIKDGASLITHCFNVMAPLHHREPGILGAALMEDIAVELIPDTVNVSPEMYPFLLNNKGINQIILITDSIRPTGLGQDGVYEFAGSEVIVKDGVSKGTDGRLTGTLLELNQGVLNFQKHSGLEIWQAIKTVSINPARVLGISDSTGTIEVGKNADLTIIDDHFEVYSTIVRGEHVYHRH